MSQVLKDFPAPHTPAQWPQTQEQNMKLKDEYLQVADI